MSRKNRLSVFQATVLMSMAGLLAASQGAAQTCTPSFTDGFQMPGVGANGTINASIMYDAEDGNGPRLYVGGQFSRAGGHLCNGIAMWNGTDFVPLGGGLPANSAATSGSGIVYAMEVLDPDGAGPMKPELWVGGSFTRAKQPAGALVTVNGLARWNGSTQTWGGVTLSGGAAQVYDLLADNQATLPDAGPDDGPRMYVVHSLTSDAVPDPFLTAYRWDGSAYSKMTLGPVSGSPVLDTLVWCLAKFGDRVYIGGGFQKGVMRMTADGNTYETLPASPAMAYENLGTNGVSAIASMVVWNNRLLIGPQDAAGPLESFDGATWQVETFGALGAPALSPVGKLEVIDLGDGVKLYFGDLAKNGYGFNQPFGLQGELPAEFNGGAVWDGVTLRPLGGAIMGPFGGMGMISTFTKTTIRGTPAVFCGGNFIGARNTDATRVQGSAGVFWSGAQWIPQYATPVNGGFSGNAVVKLDGVNSRIVQNGVDTPSYFDAANPNGILQYDGSTWTNSAITLPSGVTSASYIRYDDGFGETLFAYGRAPSGDPAKIAVQQWDNVDHAWLNVSLGASFPGATAPGLPAGVPRDAVVFDTDGAGPERPWLVLATDAGLDDFLANPPNVFAYTGTSWVVLGNGLPDDGFSNASVTSLAIHDDGSGAKLYASGQFLNPGGTIARYDGTGSTGTWTIIGQGGTGKLKVLDLGTGPALYFYGNAADVYVTDPNASPTGPIARWTGTEWVNGANASPLAKIHSTSNLVANITDIAAFDDGTGVALYAIGPFGSIGGTPARGIAKYSGTAWSALGLGLNSFTFTTGSVPDSIRLAPSALVVFDDDGSGPTAPALYIAGNNDNANGLYSERFARYGCPRNVCRADFNGTGGVTIDDLFLYINAYFSGAPAADFNGVGGVTIDDLFLYINAYFVGC